ncbi:MAG: hypothetical protein GTO22_14575 [Gemmatimonadales bacterium]|nr:hypothetical protein [Gemmatimonadales bacterium]
MNMVECTYVGKSGGTVWAGKPLQTGDVVKMPEDIVGRMRLQGFEPKATKTEPKAEAKGSKAKGKA